MYHFFAQHENIHDGYIDITGSDVNHLKNVLRIREGEKLMISSGDNVDYMCHVEEICEDRIIAAIDSEDTQGNELPCKIYLFQGLPKADKMELIIQKLTELGVYGIIPVSMKRCVVRLDSKKAESKIKRWQLIAEAAAKQSKRSVMPVVEQVMTFKEAVAYAQQLDIKLLPYECADGMEKTRKIISSIKPGQSVGIFIGPEGGFDLEELEYAQTNGFDVITLGRRILRTETAGMMLASVLMYNLE